MEENKDNMIFEKNEYKFKILYLIRKNLPKSEFLYILMFFLKYIGIILFSISLNVYDTRNINNNTNIINANIPDPNQNLFSDDMANKPVQQNYGEKNEFSDYLFKSDYYMNDNNKPEDNPNNSNNQINSSDSNNMIQSTFRKLLINGDNFKILNNSYQIICLIGFIILIIYILFWIFIIFYMRRKYYNKANITFIDKKINEINQSVVFEERLIKILTYLLFLIFFFHQYILEYYMFGFLGYILNFLGFLETSSEGNNNNYISYINSHLKNLILPEIIIIITNFLLIVFILIIFIFFMVINSSKALYINNNYPLYSSQKNLIINLFIMNLNPLFGIIHYFNDEIKYKIILVFVILIILLILIKIAINYYSFSPLPYKLYCLFIFLDFYALFGCIINLLTYLTKSEINSSKFSIIKAIFEILNALIFTIILLRKKKDVSMKIFSENLFCTNFKTLNPSGIYYYISCYLKYIQNKENNYMIIFKLIQNHVLNCNKKECPGNILLPKSLSYSIFTDFKHYSNSIEEIEKSENNITLKDDEIKEKNKNINSSEIIKKSILVKNKSKDNIILKNNNRRKSRKIDINNNEETLISYSTTNKKLLQESEFIMIGEQEIINRINFLYRRKKYYYLKKYIFLHLQYIIKIKQNYRLALYYLSKYSKSEIKFSFLSLYFLYEIKKYICKSIYDKINKKSIKDPYIIKYKEENIKLEQLIDYISLFNIVRRILKTSCEGIMQFYTFRRELHNSLSLQKYKKTKIYPILQSSEKIQSSIFNLKFLLEKLNRDKKHSLDSIELSYLICNFFKLLEGRIPQDILSNVKPILYFKDSLYDELINEFHLFMMNNPLIISLTPKDTFEILYFTNIFIKKLGFSYTDLKHKDFHEKLFPGGSDLIKEHSLILKQFLFFHSNTYSKFNTFIKSKEGYLVSINFECKIFPNFMSDFFLIANIIFNNELDKEININYNSSIKTNSNISDKKINNSNRIKNIYSFILNNEYEIFGLTKNFYLEYNLNQSMFRELRTNFCQFFCIDENKLSNQIIKERKKILQENPNLNNQICLKESNKAYTIYQNINIKNLFKIREEKIIETYNYPEIFIYEKIDKKKLIKKIPEIKNIIDEIGLDYDWYMRIQKYQDRLTCNINENNMIYNKINSDQFFEVIFSIKKMGSIIYFVVNLNELFNKDYGEHNKKLYNKKSIINNNKNFQKLGTQAANKFNKHSIKSFDGKNRKGPSKSAFFTENNLLKNENNNNEKGERKNMSGTHISNKKLDIIIEDKEILQNKKTQKKSVYDNTEYLKNIKIKKKQYLDDENTPLITRDKFNDSLFKKEKRNKIFIFILYILIIISLCLVIAKIIQSITAIDENIKVLEITINFEILKVDIYVESILHIDYCTFGNKNPFLKSITPMLQKEKLNKLMEHLNNIQEHVNTIINNKHGFKIFETIEERFDIITLADDWGISSKKVDILEETRSLSYIIGNALENNEEECEIEMFYKYLMKEALTYNNSIPNNKQKLFFYFNYNILTNYKTTFEKLSEDCTYSLEKLWEEFQNIQLYIIIIIVYILLIFFIIFCVKFCQDNSFYQLLFLYYYKIENYQNKFETQIYYLYKTSLEFNYDNIKNFEYIKTNCDITDLSITNLNKNSHDNDINIKQIKDQKKIELDQKSMNNSLLNSSMNGSSIQFLNKSNKLNLNNRIENNNSPTFDNKFEEKEENKISQEETIDTLMKFIINILPNSHRYSLIFIIISILIYLIFCVLGIYEVYNQLNQYEFSINLSMNILERVPRIMELVLYSTISILVNKTDLLLFDNHQSSYLQYFKISSLYYSEELINKYFQNNLYGQILKDNLKLKYNLENYLYNNKYSVFKNVQYWESLLNKIGDFCINLSLGQILTSEETLTSNFSNLYELVEDINKNAKICKNQISGMKDSSIKIEFNFILQEITTKYIEFIIHDKITEESLGEARRNYIDSDDFDKIITDTKMYFIYYFNTIVYALKEDFDKQNQKMSKNHIMYSILFLLINCIILLSLFFIFLKVEKYKKLFSYYSTIPKDEIINI